MILKKFIDIEKVLQEKAPRFYKILPGFTINWLKRKLHEDDINTTMTLLEPYHGLEYNDGVLNHLGVKVIAIGKENIPESGGIIIASNHPLGGLDGMALIKATGEVRSDVRFIVNDILRNLKNFGDVFVGVNKVGGKSRDSLQFIEQVYATDAAIIVFPSGLVSRKLPEGIRDLPWNKSFINKAIKYNKPIVPVFIEGKNSNFFYNFAKWRKRFGIKGNLEMLFLPDEMFSQKGKTINVYFGKPIEPSLFYTGNTPQIWSDVMRDYIYTGSIQKGISFKDFIMQ